MHFPIESSRLRIRQFEPADTDEFVGFMVDPASTRFLEFSETQKTRKGASELLQFTIDSYQSESPLMAYAVEERVSGKLAGFCGLTPRQDGEVEIMYATLPRFRGKGYAAETASSLAQYATEQLGYHRVIAPISIEHGISKAVALKAGFQDFGTREGSAGQVNMYVYEANANRS